LKSDQSTGETLRWWKEGDKSKDQQKLASALTQHFDAIESQQQSRESIYKRNLRLYNGHRGLPSQSVTSYIVGDTGEVLSLNVIASIIRSLRSKIVKNRPAPWVLTDSATMKQQLAAEQCQQFLMGAIYECGVFGVMARAFDLSCICGATDVKVYPDFDAGRIRVECMYPWEVPLDDQDAYYGSPRSRYQKSYVDRDIVREVYGGDAKEVLHAIEIAERSKGDDSFGFSGSTDQIRLVEGWHLPSGKAAKDGLHTIAIPGAAVYSHEYTRDHFPFARLLCEPDPVGFGGSGVADELFGIQQEIDETLTKIREGHSLGGNILLLVESGSKVNKAKLTNLSHAVAEYTGTQPTIATIPAVSPDVYQWVWTLVDRAYQIWGASQLSASAEKPAGLNSGKALRVFHDVETERFSYLARGYEQLMLDICDLIIDAAEDLSKVDPSFAVRYRSNEGIRKIKWREVSIARDSYVLQVQPKSYLDESGPGRVAGIQDMLDMQTLDPRAVPMLQRDPDLRAFPDPYASSLKLARSQVDAILHDGQERTAEPYQDLNLAAQVALDALQKAQTWEDVPAERIDMLRAYINGIEALLEPPAPPPAPMPPPGMMPPGMPPDPAMMGAPPMPPPDAAMMPPGGAV
jgi:hypothetical protein